MKPSTTLRIAVADDERDVRQFFQELLPRLGHEVVTVAENGRELVDQCRVSRPDLVITDIKMPEMDGLEAVAKVNAEMQVPVILITGQPDGDLTESTGLGQVMAYLTKPIKPLDLQAAIALAVARFGQFQQLSQEANDLRKALEDRKIIERAKGALMKRLRVEEDEAFRRLRKAASDQNRKLIEVAQTILKSEEVFRSLEKP